MKKILFMAALAVFLTAGPALAGTFTDNGDSTVSDSDTGLMWQQGEDGGMQTWAGALTYCNGLSLAGHSDWRLPNIKELESLTDDSKFNLAIDTGFFPGANASYHWSSTTYAGNTNNAWVVAFYNGYVYYGDKTVTYYVRCVR